MLYGLPLHYVKQTPDGLEWEYITYFGKDVCDFIAKPGVLEENGCLLMVVTLKM